MCSKLQVPISDVFNSDGSMDLSGTAGAKCEGEVSDVDEQVICYIMFQCMRWEYSVS